MLGKKNYDFTKLETAIIHGGGWKSPEGIAVGLTIDDLNRINGKPIDLFIMENGIAAVRWQEGTVNQNLKVLVDTDTRKVIEIQVDFR
ncbi:MAG: hypothetical protein HC817_11970 [Saprospiraceae bacterium]|nr:hypothetical protein [Saprospiraceae bacterium]